MGLSKRDTDWHKPLADEDVYSSFFFHLHPCRLTEGLRTTSIPGQMPPYIHFPADRNCISQSDEKA